MATALTPKAPKPSKPKTSEKAPSLAEERCAEFFKGRKDTEAAKAEAKARGWSDKSIRYALEANGK